MIVVLLNLFLNVIFILHRAWKRSYRKNEYSFVPLLLTCPSVVTRISSRRLDLFRVLRSYKPARSTYQLSNTPHNCLMERFCLRRYSAHTAYYLVEPYFYTATVSIVSKSMSICSLGFLNVQFLPYRCQVVR
jgi:hypothetical protein